MSELIKSPVTGIVVEVRKRIGDACEAGECIVILESMKMQFNVEASFNGVIEEVRVKDGDTVEEGETLARVRVA